MIVPVNLKGHGQAVIDGARSMLAAARGWGANPQKTQVNRSLWGSVRPNGLLLGTTAGSNDGS